MSFCLSRIVQLTADGSGDGTAYTLSTVSGKIESVQLIEGSPAPDNTADYVLTGESTTTPILTVSTGTDKSIYYPRAATVDILAAASLYAAVGEPVETQIAIAGERIKVVGAQMGSGGIANFRIILTT